METIVHNIPAIISAILLLVLILMVITNIITQVLKKATWDKLPTNILALIVSVALTLAAGIAYLQIKAIAISWWMILTLIVIGFMVAFAAMFGFDKLMETVEWWRKYKECKF